MDKKKKIENSLAKNLPSKKTSLSTQLIDQKDIKDDYDFSRATYKDLIHTGTRSLDVMAELARESEHPRAFEVAGQLIKTISDTNNDLVKLHKSAKEVLSDPNTGPDKVTNNLFVGSTADLTNLLGGNARDVLRKK